MDLSDERESRDEADGGGRGYRLRGIIAKGTDVHLQTMKAMPQVSNMNIPPKTAADFNFRCAPHQGSSHSMHSRVLECGEVSSDSGVLLDWARTQGLKPRCFLLTRKDCAPDS